MENIAGTAMDRMRGNMRAVPILFWLSSLSSIESFLFCQNLDSQSGQHRKNDILKGECVLSGDRGCPVRNRKTDGAHILF